MPNNNQEKKNASSVKIEIVSMCVLKIRNFLVHFGKGCFYYYNLHLQENLHFFKAYTTFWCQNSVWTFKLACKTLKLINNVEQKILVNKLSSKSDIAELKIYCFLLFDVNRFFSILKTKLLKKRNFLSDKQRLFSNISYLISAKWFIQIN